MAWAGTETSPGPFNFRGCDLRAECLAANEEVRVQFPATAPIFEFNKSRTSLCGRVSKTQLAWGSTRAACHFSISMGSWQTRNALALQASSCGSVTRRLHQPSPAPWSDGEGCPPSPRAKVGFPFQMPPASALWAISLRGTRLKYREKPHKLL